MEKRKILKEKILYVIATILFVLPSYIYLLRKKTFTFFDKERYFLHNNTNFYIQQIIFLLVMAFITFAYINLIKNHKKNLKGIKRILIFVLFISLIFIFVTPFLSSDIYYYLGTGRLTEKYNQNPYYISIKKFVDENKIDLSKDSMLQEGYNNCWSNTTVVYGPIWTIACMLISKISFGNADIGLMSFKIMNVFLNVINCYLVYKISRREKYAVIYGLNPLILINGIASMHNDLFMIFLVLLSIYMIVRKKNIIFSLIFLSLAVNVKFVMILLLPFIVLYYLRKESISRRILKCILYGIGFFIITILPYLIYMKDFSIFTCMLVQRTRFANGIYAIMFLCNRDLANILKNVALGIFVIIYFIVCLKILLSKKIVLKDLMNKFFYIIISFTFLLLTNFQPWYIIWLSSFFMLLSAKNIRIYLNIQKTFSITYPCILLNSNIYVGLTLYIFTLFVLADIYVRMLKEIKNKKNKLKLC